MALVHAAYRHERGGHCGSGALRDLTEWAGLRWTARPPTEGLVFALSGGLDFSYVRSNALLPPIYLVGRGADLEETFLTNLGARFEVRSTDDPDLGWKWVTDQVDHGTPVMVWADIAELPYLRARLSMSRHDIVIAGYDDDQQIAYVVDNDRDTTQAVPYENLRRARSSTGFPVPTRHTTYVVDWPAEPPGLPPIAGAALRRSAEALATTIETAPIVVRSDAAALGNGTGGVKVFADDLAVWSEVFDDETLESALFTLSALIEKAGTGGGLFRRLQAEGCREVAAILDCDLAAAAADAARHAAHMWTEVAAAAYDSSAPVRRRAAATAEAATELPRAEEKLTEALRLAGDALLDSR
ncbi:MAG: BtrH N-terminal domain-containing protein [Mycobacteriaceae bacterium]|nr:BtrH N-terminal domain-containing protein [Mycobacteriaceae bacterium]